MTVAELRDVFRARLDDLVAPYLISDALFLDYLNEAEEEACIRAELLRDKSSAFCSIAVTATDEEYTLDSSIFAIAKAYLVDAGNSKSALISTEDSMLDVLDPNWRGRVEKPKWFIHRDSSIELTPVPNDDYTLKLEVYRLPIASMALDTDSPEINRIYHRYLLYWALHRAYLVPDSDIFDERKAAQNESEFTKLFGFRPMANTRKKQYRNIPHRNQPSPI